MLIVTMNQVNQSSNVYERITLAMEDLVRQCIVNGGCKTVDHARSELFKDVKPFDFMDCMLPFVYNLAVIKLKLEGVPVDAKPSEFDQTRLCVCFQGPSKPVLFND